MTLNDLNRGALAVFAARNTPQRASLEEMKAICYCIRNRVRKWGESWIHVMEHADEFAGNEAGARVYLDIDDRAFQRLMRDVDDIYYGHGVQGAMDSESDSGDLESALCADKHECLYWCYINRPRTKWFAEKIEGDRANHPMRSQMGLMMFFE
jgi:hypothetical protein